MTAPLTAVRYPSEVAYGYNAATQMVIRAYSRERTGNRQRRPYNIISPFKSTVVRAQGNGTWSNTDVSRGNSYADPDNGLSSEYFGIAGNKAYSRFIMGLHKLKMGWGINLMEYVQTRNMVAARALQLGRAAQAFRRGEISRGVRALGVSPKSGTPERLVTHRKHLPKDAADFWLEYSFGWSPILSDIYTLLSLFSQPMPELEVRGRGSCSYSRVDWLSSEFPKHNITGTNQVQYGARIKLVNPNLFLLDQLGVINPAQVAWDAVPFSFVVDWFIPVNKWLGSWTDFVGLELLGTYTTYRGRFVEGSVSPTWKWNGVPCVKKNTGFVIKRTTGAPAYTFVPKGFSGLSLWHIPTSLALTQQSLSRIASLRGR